MTKRTPNALWFGTPLRGPLEVALTPPPMGHTSGIKHMHDRLRMVRAMQEECRRWMSTYKRIALLETENDPHKLVLKVGDECVVHMPSCQPVLSKKLAYRYHGPYIVVGTDVKNDRYKVDIEGTTKWIKSKRLKRFNPRQIADRTSKLYATEPETGACADKLVSQVLLVTDLDNEDEMRTVSDAILIPIGLQHTEGDDGTHGREHDHGQMIHAVSHAGSTADVKYTALHSHQEYENHPTPLTTGTVHAMVYRI